METEFLNLMPIATLESLADQSRIGSRNSSNSTGVLVEINIANLPIYALNDSLFGGSDWPAFVRNALRMQFLN